MQLVAGSMRDAFGVNKESRFAGIVENNGLPTADKVESKNARSRLNWLPTTPRRPPPDPGLH